MPCNCKNCLRDKILNGSTKINCGDCQCPITVTDESSFVILSDGSGKVVCSACFQKNYGECSHCGNVHYLNDFKEVKRRIDGEMVFRKVCGACYTKYYKCCAKCGEDYNSHDVMQYKEESYCPICFDKSFAVCGQCNYVHPLETVTANPARGGKRFCKPCNDYIGPIYVYDTRSKKVFLGRPPHFYGVELEVELKNHNRADRGAKAKQVLDLFGDFAFVKEDGSLNCGFEICTVPASKDEQTKRWNDFFDKLPDNLVSYDSSNCGLHIHSSRVPLSLLTIAKVVVFVNNGENLRYIEQIAGRNSNHFCQISSKKKHGSVRPNSGSRNDRYEAVNITGKDTIEFRLFKGTLKRESFFKALEFCDALIKFCMLSNHSISHCKSWDNFAKFVEQNVKEYPHLYAFICAKFKGQKTKLTEKFGFRVTNERNFDNNVDAQV